MVCLKHILSKEILGPKRFLVQKDFWSNKIFGSKYILGQNKLLIPKKFWPKECPDLKTFWVKKILS